MPAPPMEGNCLTKIIKDTPPITDLRVLDSDDDLVDKVNDIWMDINLETSLGGSNSNSSNGANKLVTSEEKHVQTDKLTKIRKTGLRHFRKSKGGITAITEKLPKESTTTTTAMTTTATTTTATTTTAPVVPRIEKCPVKETVSVILPASVKSVDKERESRRSLDSSLKAATSEKPRKRARSVEFDTNSSQDQEELLKEFKSLKRKRSIGQIQDEIEMLKTSIDELRNLKTNNATNNNSANNNNNAVNTSNLTNSDNNTPPSSDTKVCPNGSLPMLPDTKPATGSRRRFSSIFDDPSESSLENAPEEVCSKNCVDSDIKIQLSNVNLQIRDKKETTNGALCNANSSKEGFKIEINVSRVESQRLNDNEIVSKSDQQLNISLPSSSPMSCKVDCRTSVTMSDEEKESAKSLDKPALPAKDSVEEAPPVSEKKKEKNKEKEKEARDNVEETKEEEEEEENILAFENKNAEMEDDKCLSIGKPITVNNSKKEVDLDNELLKKLEKRESDIENALKKLNECCRNSLNESKEEKEPKNDKEPEFFENRSFVDTPGCSKDFDFDNFDVEPFDDKSDDYLKDLLSTDVKEQRRGSANCKTVGYLNPLFHLEKLENLNAVPVYTTKDGKITYSPNPNYTYRALIIEARQREGHLLFRDYYEKESGRRNRYYSTSKSQDYDYEKKYSKSHKYKYDHSKVTDKYSEDDVLGFENCLANENLELVDKKIEEEIDELKRQSEREACEKRKEIMGDYNESERHKSLESKKDKLNRDRSKNNDLRSQDTANNVDERISSPIILRNESLDKNMPSLDDRFDESKRNQSPGRETDHNLKNMKRCIIDLQNLKEDILKKLDDQVAHSQSRVQEFVSHRCASAELQEKEESKEEEEEEEEEEIFDRKEESIICAKQIDVVETSKEVTNIEDNNLKVEDDELKNKNDEQAMIEPIILKNDMDDDESPIKSLFEIEKEKTFAETQAVEHITKEPSLLNTSNKMDTNLIESKIYSPIEQIETNNEVLEKPAPSESIDLKESEVIKLGEQIQISELSQSHKLEHIQKEISSSLLSNEEVVNIQEPKESLDNVPELPRNLKLSKIESKSPKHVVEISENESTLPDTVKLTEMELKSSELDSPVKITESESSLPELATSTLTENKLVEPAKPIVVDNKLIETTETIETKANTLEPAQTVEIVQELPQLETVIETEVITEPTEVINNELMIPEPVPITETEIIIQDFNKPTEIEELPEPPKLFKIKDAFNKTPPNEIPISLNSYEKSEDLSMKEEPMSQKENREKSKSPEYSLRLPCSIDKSSFSFELCDQFINQEKMYASRMNTTVKTVPKLVIRKSDTNPKFFSKSKSVDEDTRKEPCENINMKSPVHPKIPKMIIRNARSRPATPSIEEISETSCSSTTDNEPKSLKVKIKLDDKGEPMGQRQNSCDATEAKIPKMKIKLEEKLPRVVVENIDLSTIEHQKTVPKMKITNVKGSKPKIMDKQQAAVEDDKTDTNSSFPDAESHRVREKSRSRSKKDSPGYNSCSEYSERKSKRTKRSPKEEVHLDPNHEDAQFLLENEYRQRNNSNSCCSSSVSTKIPKVIIKRTSPSAEFKCELSKEAIVNAQPQVLLRRSSVLDCMAKDLRHMKIMVKATPSKEEAKQKNKTESNELQWERYEYYPCVGLIFCYSNCILIK